VPGQLQLRVNFFTHPKLINALLFQLAWFGCVAGGDSLAFALLVIIFYIHIKYLKLDRTELIFIGLVAFAGFLMDTILSIAGIFKFENIQFGYIPTWLICLWMIFATTINLSLAWLHDRLLLALVLGAIGGPMSYFAGSNLSSVVIAPPQFVSLVIISLCWAVFFPLVLYAARRLLK
jgi:hypothetical protein